MYKKTRATTVDAYIQLTPDIQRLRLKSIRQLIHNSSSDIQEKISYDMPAFVYKGKPLVYFAAQTKHIGLYALPEANIEFSEELKQYKTGKGSIQFLNKEDLPLDLIKQIIAFRIHLIDELRAQNDLQGDNFKK